MGKREIYDVFRKHGISHIGACALIGNLKAESDLNPCANEELPQHRWEQYVGEVDSGAISRNDFIYAGYGFGLAQWTYWSRRQELYDYAAESGESIGDEYMQCQFVLYELCTHFEGLLQYLKETDDLRIAVSRICKEYERPAINNIDTRYMYACQAMREIEDGEVVNDDGDGDATEPTVEDVGSCEVCVRVLKMGDKGRDVLMLQTALNDMGCDSGRPDGDYGVLTYAAVKSLQRNSNLKVNGVCGCDEWQVIFQ
jgi:hypothetical protein